MFKPGVSGNPKGRAKGAENKLTKEIRAKIGLILNNNIDKVDQDLKELSAKDRLSILLQLMKFVTPQLKQVEIDQEQHLEHNFTPIIIDFSNEKR